MSSEIAIAPASSVVGSSLVAMPRLSGHAWHRPGGRGRSSRLQQKRFQERHPQAKMAMYDTVEEMLAKENLDLVSVCTWPPLHADGVVAAAQAKAKGIVCEKPMTNSLGEADRMLEACNANGTKLIVSHQRRFNKRYVEAKQALKEGKIGQLVEIRGFCGATCKRMARTTST